MSESQQPTQRRVLPQNELDLQLMTLNAVWGVNEINYEFKEKLSQYYVTEEDGERQIHKKTMWDMLSYFTRDLRLANLSPLGEYQEAQHFLLLSGDLLQYDLPRAFLCSLTRVATVCELSQSKNGFVRRKLNTFTHEQIQRQDEPPKKSLFGGQKKQEV